MLFSNDTLLYGIAGWTMASVRDSLAELATLQSVSRRLDGITLGAGIEQRVSVRWHVSAEVRAMLYESDSSTTPVANPFLGGFQHSRIEAHARSIRLGLTYHFNE